MLYLDLCVVRVTTLSNGQSIGSVLSILEKAPKPKEEKGYIKIDTSGTYDRYVNG